MKSQITDLIENKILFLLTFFFIVSCGNNYQQTDKTQISGTPVQITHPQKIDFTEYIDLNANTIFLKKEIIRSTFQGFIKKMYKNIGDDINRGDNILSLITKEAATFDSLISNLAENTLSSPVIIVAHSDGVLTTLNFHEGDFVSEGEEIAVIANPSSLRISLNVPYTYISKISPNSGCQVILPNGQTFPAKISKIIPSVDPASQTQTFLLRPEKRVNVPENLNVTARLPLQTIENAIVLPRSAVLSNETQDNFWVMELVNDSIARRVDVQKGMENDSLIQITKPLLSLSNKIINDGGFGLPDSVKVVVTNSHE
jgi:hypothetical protein